MNVGYLTASPPFSPFDHSAVLRQKRMGLLEENGRPDKDAAAVMARLYAGLLYDNIMDFYADPDVAYSVCDGLAKAVQETGAKERFLRICAAYDGIYHDLPEPVWWIAGNLELVAYFSESFLCRMAELMEECEAAGSCAL